MPCLSCHSLPYLPWLLLAMACTLPMQLAGAPAALAIQCEQTLCVICVTALHTKLRARAVQLHPTSCHAVHSVPISCRFHLDAILGLDRFTRRPCAVCRRPCAVCRPLAQLHPCTALRVLCTVDRTEPSAVRPRRVCATSSPTACACTRVRIMRTRPSAVGLASRAMRQAIPMAHRCRCCCARSSTTAPQTLNRQSVALTVTCTAQ